MVGGSREERIGCRGRADGKDWSRIPWSARTPPAAAHHTLSRQFRVLGEPQAGPAMKAPRDHGRLVGEGGRLSLSSAPFYCLSVCLCIGRCALVYVLHLLTQ